MYPQVESLLGGDAQIPCNISHPPDDTLLMILVYYNARSSSRSNGSSSTANKPIALTSGPPIFSLDLRLHSQYIHRYLHQNKFPDKFKHQTKRAINSFDSARTTSNRPPMLNLRNGSPRASDGTLGGTLDRTLEEDLEGAPDETVAFLDSNRTFNAQSAAHSAASLDGRSPFGSHAANSAGSVLKRKLRDLDLDKKANELLTSAQFISPAYAGRLAFNFSANREKFLLKLSKLKERDDGEYVCRTDFKWSRTLISVVNLFVIGE